MFNMKGNEMKKVELNIKIEVSEKEYLYMLKCLKDISGSEKKEDLENFIGSGLEYEIEENNSVWLFE